MHGSQWGEATSSAPSPGPSGLHHTSEVLGVGARQPCDSRFPHGEAEGSKAKHLPPVAKPASGRGWVRTQLSQRPAHAFPGASYTQATHGRVPFHEVAGEGRFSQTSESRLCLLGKPLQGSGRDAGDLPACNAPRPVLVAGLRPTWPHGTAGRTRSASEDVKSVPLTPVPSKPSPPRPPSKLVLRVSDARFLVL